MTEHGDLATQSHRDEPSRKRPRMEEESDNASTVNTTDDTDVDDDNASICSEILDAPPDSPVPEPSESGEYKIKRLKCDDASEAARNLFLNPEYSDFKIIVRGHTFPAHKSVVCRQSEYFTCAFRSAFIENQESIINITDESPKTIYRLLQYLYQKYYISDPTSPPESTQQNGHTESPPASCLSPYEKFQYATRVNFTMYRVADKYGIPGLSRLAVFKQSSALRTHNTISAATWSAFHCYSRFEGRHDAMRMTHVAVIAKILWKMPQKDLFYPPPPCPFPNPNLRSNQSQTEGLKNFHTLCASSGHFTFDTFQYLLWLQSHHGHDWPPAAADGENERPQEWVRNGRGGWDIVYGWEFSKEIMGGFMRRRMERDELAKRERERLIAKVRRLERLELERGGEWSD